MSRIVVFGGHGRIALLLAPLLVADGHEVTAVIRSAAQTADVEASGATPLVADVERFDTAELAAVVAGHDAVVWSAGAGGGNPERTYAVDRDAAIRTMDAASAAGVARFVMVSWAGSRPDHGVPPSSPFFAYADAKLAADEHLRGSSLDGTILGPGTLSSDPPDGAIELDPVGGGTVSRADVAAVIEAVLADDATIGRTIRFIGGGTPLRDALRHEEGRSSTAGVARGDRGHRSRGSTSSRGAR